MSYARERWRVWKKKNNGSDLKLSGLILRSSKVEFWKRKAWGDRWICFKTARVKRWQSQKIVLKDVYENIRISFLHVKTQTTHKTREKTIMSEMIDRVLTSRRLCAWMDFSFILIRSKRKKKGKSAARQGTQPGIPEVMGPVMPNRQKP